MRSPLVRTGLGGLVGGLVGLSIGVLVYLAANPALEASDSWLEEFQGLVWNIVPLGAVVGLAVGIVLAARRR